MRNNNNSNNTYKYPGSNYGVQIKETLPYSERGVINPFSWGVTNISRRQLLRTCSSTRTCIEQSIRSMFVCNSHYILHFFVTAGVRDRTASGSGVHIYMGFWGLRIGTKGKRGSPTQTSKMST